MSYKTYTFDELKQFIQAQKDERMLNSKDASIQDIGDLLAHFARKKLKKVVNFTGPSVIFYGNRTKFMMPSQPSDIEKVFKLTTILSDKNVSTYGEVKKVLNKLES